MRNHNYKTKIYRTIFLIIIILIIQSCNSERDEGKLNLDEISILNFVIDYDSRPDSLVRKFYYQPINLGFDLFDTVLTKKQKKIIDSVKAIYDTISFYVFIEDTLRYYENDLQFLNEKLKIKNFSKYFENIDTAYIPLIRQITDTTIKRKIDISLLKSKNNYKIKPINQYNDLTNRKTIISLFKFSKIAFNKRKDRACIYIDRRIPSINERYYGSHHGYILFLEKINNKWIYHGLYLAVTT